MPAADTPTPAPPILVVLPDDQVVRGRLYERRQWPIGGWMYWVGIAMWATDGPRERVVAQEYRVWLTPEQARPVEGTSYDAVPTYPLPRREEPKADAGRWGWKVQRIRQRGGPGSVVVHVWDCPQAPAGEEELDVLAALEVMRSTAGATACKECGAAVALGPLLP
ncbi:DUF6233 domain-containing protein [Streptomyces sp. NPDC007851]|uniref:DUF6233 domain-containing protein n=1 Tax=Streptomyces sp. NPDC007851 TaxID=3155008 RepID=UPI00340D9430